jgi:hypothetical protein
MRLGLFCSFFLVTLLALLIFFYLNSISILGMMEMKTFHIILKGQDPPQGDLKGTVA